MQWRDQASASAAAAAATGGDSGGSVGLGFTNSRPPPPPAVCNTAILKAMGKAGKVDEALAWLEDTTTAAAAAADNGDRAAAAAQGVASSSSSSSSVPVGLDHSSFMAVLSACSKAGRWESARSVLGGMDRAGVVPETVAFNTVLAGEARRERERERGHNNNKACRGLPVHEIDVEFSVRCFFLAVLGLGGVFCRVIRGEAVNDVFC